jgi:hypothetical protein
LGVFCGALQHSLRGGLTLPSVTFAYAAGTAGKRISKEEGNYPLIPSSTMLWLCWLGQLWLNMQAQAVCGGFFFMCY